MTLLHVLLRNPAILRLTLLMAQRIGPRDGLKQTHGSFPYAGLTSSLCRLFHLGVHVFFTHLAIGLYLSVHGLLDHVLNQGFRVPDVLRSDDRTIAKYFVLPAFVVLGVAREVCQLLLAGNPFTLQRAATATFTAITIRLVTSTE